MAIKIRPQVFDVIKYDVVPKASLDSLTHPPTPPLLFTQQLLLQLRRRRRADECKSLSHACPFIPPPGQTDKQQRGNNVQTFMMI